ncbi:thioesterase II family protein [Amycolatopsis dendrobii]|uniref:thioesterase II family protein n=1 Tax=Amycolatopsis dendrobii TaxID=2760662 RepID=UPI001C720BCA|nr:thioesterase domain-containing protein [Amycolatopsis dendrobii]
MPDTPWLPGFSGETGAVPRLVCLHHAGGTASTYQGWQRHLAGVAQVVPVLLPGRDRHVRARPHAGLEPLADELAETLIAHGLADRYAFFGHSMGALLAYELSCRLRDRGHGEPLHLFVSGSRAPHLYGPAQVSDAEVLSAAGQHAVPESAVLRADLALCDSYAWTPRRPLRCPVTAFRGSDDPLANAVEVEAWRSYTQGSLVVRQVAGGHFFLAGAGRSRVLNALRAELAVFRSASDKGEPLCP